jgi:hypothetical protein
MLVHVVRSIIGGLLVLVAIAVYAVVGIVRLATTGSRAIVRFRSNHHALRRGEKACKGERARLLPRRGGAPSFDARS